MATPGKIPLTVLTGFLGSGKTTLLGGLLKTPALANSAVLINEFGETGLDHHLVETPDLTQSVVLDGGCICCTMRGALAGALRTLYWQRHDGKVPRFARVILETTGLASPGPLLQELMQHPAILQHYRLAGVVVCVDGVFGLGQLDAQPEAAQQAAVADRLLITKADLIDEAQRQALVARLLAINPGADLAFVHGGVADGAVIDDGASHDPLSKKLDMRQWLRAERYRPVEVRRGAGFSRRNLGSGDANRHGADIQAFCLRFDEPLPWEPLLTALEVLGALRGDQLLRVKGIVDAQGESRPLVVHGVHNMLYPATTLQAWPDGRRGTQLVFIVRNTEPAFIAHTLDYFLHGALATLPTVPPDESPFTIALNQEN